jgi:NifU-like protein involved in Fe-S cluster formation
MVTAAMRELVRAGVGCGELGAAATGRARAEHPVCGDELELEVVVDGDGRLERLAWRASGCPATLAVAAVAADCLPGERLQDAPERLDARLRQLGGLARHEQHAVRMLQRALAEAGG